MSTKSPGTRVLSIDGANYTLALPDWETDYIQGKIADSGEPYELAMLRSMAERLETGGIVIDVGANVGNHTLYLAAVAGCQVYAFEPNAHLCEAMEQSVELNGLTGRVQIQNAGVGAAPGKARFVHENESNLGAQALSVGDNAKASIDVVRLDDFEFADKVRAIKIDVEGMEPDVLEGARETINRDQPLLYVECQSKANFHSITNWMQKNSYLYRQSFNATPTHLFIHKSQVEGEDAPEATLIELREHVYDKDQALRETKDKLNASNQKYREANERITALKEDWNNAGEQVAALQEKLNAANQKYRESGQRLSALREQLDESGHEKSELQKQLDQEERLRKQAQQHAENLKVQLTEATESEIEVQKQLDIESQNRRQAEQRVASLKEQLSEADERVVELQKKLDTANQKYRELSERLNKLREDWQKAREEIVELQEQVEATEKNRENLEDRAATLEEDLRQANWRETELQHQLSAAEESFHEVQQRAAALEEAQAETAEREQQTNDKLHAANLKYREASQRIDDLKDSLNNSQMELKERSQQVRAVKRQLASAQQSPLYIIRKYLYRLKRRFRPVSKPNQPQSLKGQPHTAEPLQAYTQADQSSPTPARELRVACIMDDFTFHSYRPEARFYQLTPEHWQQELEECQPELLFIESAWRGKDELWGSKVGHRSQEVQSIVEWCNHNQVPTVFWNKEDPVHFETFLNTAKLFDHVFTTDLDCVHRYKGALRHERVYFLPFACQPRLTNPVETYNRKDAFCFAGAYYARYPERTKDLETFVEEFPKFRPLEIYDRNYGKDDPNYQFPEQYQPYIVGTLPFSEIDKAYKGYRYAINLNSIKQSQTMFARRVFELLASNTITVSNFSRGIRLMFGDLVLCSHSGSEIIERLTNLEDEPQKAEKYRLAGLRKALREHTYQNRLDFILSQVTGQPQRSHLPGYTIVALVNSDWDVAKVLDNAQRQNHPAQGVLLIADSTYSLDQARAAAEMHESSGTTQYISFDALADEPISAFADTGTWVARFAPDDYYGPNYLMDIALATHFTDAPVIGKGAWYQATSEGPELRNIGAAYQAGADLPVKACVIAPTAQTENAQRWVQASGIETMAGRRTQAIDPFNYACDALSPDMSEEQASAAIEAVEDESFEEGLSLKDLTVLAENTAAESVTEEQLPSYSPQELDQLFENRGSRNVRLTLDEDGLTVTSQLADGKHEYIYQKSQNAVQLSKLLEEQHDKASLPLHLEMIPGLNLSLVAIFYDQEGNRLQHRIIPANKNSETDVPHGATKVLFGYRVYQRGEGTVRKLLVGRKDLSPAAILGRSDVLLLTNNYPSYDDLYRNGFVHTRVKAYQKRGLWVDVFRFRKDDPVSWHEFQNVDIVTGNDTALRRMLESGRYRHVLVHFLDTEMWAVIGDFIDQVKVTVWVHGADIQPWYRRKFDLDTENEERKAKELSEKRINFWRSILNPIHNNLHLVFVSNYLAEEAMEDLGLRLPNEQYSIIPNPINTELFFYREKRPEQRKKILSIRPHASRVYANDLVVKSILDLSKESFFYELEFRIIGDGKLFDQTVEPLREFSNVTIEKRFLAQQEIAALHKHYGVFLCPSRMDTQGVSRDEAMSSGLVPVTSNVGAVPEFVTSEMACLASFESYKEISDFIKKIYNSPDMYSRMSYRSASNAHQKVDINRCVSQEMSLIK